MTKLSHFWDHRGAEATAFLPVIATVMLRCLWRWNCEFGGDGEGIWEGECA